MFLVDPLTVSRYKSLLAQGSVNHPLRHYLRACTEPLQANIRLDLNPLLIRVRNGDSPRNDPVSLVCVLTIVADALALFDLLKGHTFYDLLKIVVFKLLVRLEDGNAANVLQNQLAVLRLATTRFNIQGVQELPLVIVSELVEVVRALHDFAHDQIEIQIFDPVISALHEHLAILRIKEALPQDESFEGLLSSPFEHLSQLWKDRSHRGLVGLTLVHKGIIVFFFLLLRGYHVVREDATAETG